MFLIFFSKSLENTSGRLHFTTVSSHMAVALLTKGTLSQEFCKILPIDSNGNIIELKTKEINTIFCTVHQHKKSRAQKQRVLAVAYLEPSQHVRWSSL